METNIEARKSYSSYEEVYTEVCDKIKNGCNQFPALYMQLNNLRYAVENYCKHSECQYIGKKFSGDVYVYPTFTNPSRYFETTKEAKLYDTLCEFMDSRNDDNMISSIITLVTSYSNSNK